MATETAVFAAGCFWGVEEWYRHQDGVVSTTVGYMGGSLTHPTYEQVKSGTTGHAEVCRVVFNPKVTSYGALVQQFFELHDPTQLNRQGCDVGTQYRSVIFYSNAAQRDVAQKIKGQVAPHWKENIVTAISPAEEFWPAEDYHQQYFKKNPDSPCYGECHRLPTKRKEESEVGPKEESQSGAVTAESGTDHSSA